MSVSNRERRQWKALDLHWKPGEIGLAAGGAFAGIFLVSSLGVAAHQMLLIAPFGASSVLLFGAPGSPFAQPRNVIGGHAVSSLCGLLVLTVLGTSSVALATGVALALAAMMLTRTVHPPAGADPIVIIGAHAAWTFLAAPILVGTLLLVAAAIAYHRLVTGIAYPARPVR